MHKASQGGATEIGWALVAAAARFNRKGGWIMSSHIAMSMMLASFPFILFVVSMAGFLSQDLDTDSLIELLFGTWPEEVASPIIAEIQKVVTSSSTQLMTFGGLLAIYFASNGVNAVRVSMALAYRETDTLPFWKARLLSLAFVLGGGALIMLAATVEVALPLYFNFVAQATPEMWGDWFSGGQLLLGLTFVVPVLSVIACHLWLPGQRHTLRQILPGVVLTLGLWAAAVQGFAIYIARFSTYGATYAGLAGAMAALMFMYLMAAILIYGAQFNGELIVRRASDV
jgi:membrane protein